MTTLSLVLVTNTRLQLKFAGDLEYRCNYFDENLHARKCRLKFSEGQIKCITGVLNSNFDLIQNNYFTKMTMETLFSPFVLRCSKMELPKIYFNIVSENHIYNHICKQIYPPFLCFYSMLTTFQDD